MEARHSLSRHSNDSIPRLSAAAATAVCGERVERARGNWRDLFVAVLVCEREEIDKLISLSPICLFALIWLPNHNNVDLYLVCMCVRDRLIFDLDLDLDLERRD
ncbi:uncharacterized protein MEPE_03321 [Melanopsichium pennsylvanicum]|uniref:Uncharacterized protein n=1 Tax=Melanopsichium pennsylvanicum TaxID=63383 RepID=A0AAJ4XMK9_9BASI|nr:uncharacterized protein MEPE_03321 [Melanopsichium pennsylvanicum]